MASGDVYVTQDVGYYWIGDSGGFTYALNTAAWGIPATEGLSRLVLYTSLGASSAAQGANGPNQNGQLYVDGVLRINGSVPTPGANPYGGATDPGQVLMGDYTLPTPRTREHTLQAGVYATGLATWQLFYPGIRIYWESTPLPAGAATTDAATNVQRLTATLNGHVNPNGYPSQSYFQYGLTTAYGSQTPAQLTGSGASSTPVSANISGLTPGRVYHCRVVTVNTYTGVVTYGNDVTFVTQSAGLAMML
jgi:hypothetical protein